MNKRIAIVYDWIDKWGGVERVLLVLHEMFPQADFFTSHYDPQGAFWARKFNIKTSFLQNFPGFIRKNRIISFPFYPFAFESLNFSDYDLIISVTSSFAKSIITKPGIKHICYLLTPTRYLWIQPERYFRNKLTKKILNQYIDYIKSWDYLAAQRPDKIISISHTVADRCRRYYKRKSEVIYPPFDVQYWKNIKHQILNIKYTNKISKIKSNFYLVVSRLESYKRVDLVVEVFNKLALPSKQRSYQDGYSLVIVGEGSEESNLKRSAGKNILFLSKLTDQQLGWLYTNAQALIMPQEEDFGYVSLEAQFFGCPVIAYHKGGVSETVVDGKTGLLFNKQNERSLLSALERYGRIKYNLKQSTKVLGLRNIEKFENKKFINSFQNVISTLSEDEGEKSNIT